MKDFQKKLIFAGNGSYSNRGCEAIVRGTVTLFREKIDCGFISNYFPSEGCVDAEHEIDPEIVHCPIPQLKRYSMPWFEEQFTRKVFRQPHNVVRVLRTFQHSLPDALAAMMLGGDNYTLDNGDPRIHFRLNHLALRHNVPVIIWGASVGPFTNDTKFEQWASKELREVSLIGVRETETVKYLKSIGVYKNVILMADPAFFLQPAAVELPPAIEEILTNGSIGVNLSPFLYRFLSFSDSSQKNFRDWIKIAAEVIKNILRRFSEPVLLIPHVTSEIAYWGRDDYLLLRKVADMVQEPDRVFVLDPNLDAAQTKWVISRVRVFAGARTHSTLAAISSNVPTICIGYSMKAKGIAKDTYGHMDWLIPGQELIKDPSALSNRMLSLYTQKADIQSRLAEMNPIFQQRARKAVDHVIDIITT